MIYLVIDCIMGNSYLMEVKIIVHVKLIIDCIGDNTVI